MRRLLAGLSTVALLGAVLACAPSEAPTVQQAQPTSGITKITVGVIPIVDVAPIYLGKAKGIFAKHNIDLKLETSQGGAGIIAGVVSGRYQFGFSNMTSLMLAHTRGVPLRAVTAGCASTGVAGEDMSGVLVRRGSPVRDAADLAGRKVAVNLLKNIGDTTIRESVRKAGGDPSGIKFVEVPFPQMVEALESGQVDAAWMTEPSMTLARRKGARVVASNFVDPAPDLTVAAYFTSEKVASANLDLVKRFHEAMGEALEYASAHTAEVRAIVPTYAKIDRGLVKEMTLPRWPTSINVASVRTLAKLGEQDGLFTKPPDLETLLS